MKMTGSAYFLVVIMATMALVSGLALNMKFMELKLLPLVLSIIVFVLAAAALVREILHTRRVATSEAIGTAEGGALIIRRHLTAYSWLLGYFLAIYLFGFLAAIVILVLAYMRTHGGRWRAAISLAILLPVIAFILFDLLLNIDLYTGIVYMWLERLI